MELTFRDYYPYTDSRYSDAVVFKINSGKTATFFGSYLSYKSEDKLELEKIEVWANGTKLYSNSNVLELENIIDRENNEIRPSMFKDINILNSKYEIPLWSIAEIQINFIFKGLKLGKFVYHLNEKEYNYEHNIKIQKQINNGGLKISFRPNHSLTVLDHFNVEVNS